MTVYHPDDKSGEEKPAPEDRPARICPECNAVFGPDVNFCPNDGTALVSMPIRKTCPECHKNYSPYAQFCPVDGAELLDVMPAGEGFEKTTVIDGQLYGLNRLGETEKDDIQRSKCPNCGAWKNWTGEGRNYICKTCGSHYLYEGEDAFRVLGKIDDQGNLVTDAGTGAAAQAEKLQEESPYYELLSEIDRRNRDHWIKKFRGFKRDRFNRSWNWPSFFFGPFRYFLKGMSIRGVLYLAGALVLFSLIAVLTGPNRLGGGSNPFLTVASILTNVFFASMGSNDYYRFCQKYRNDIRGAKRAKKIGMVNAVLFGVVYLAINMFSRVVYYQ